MTVSISIVFPFYFNDKDRLLCWQVQSGDWVKLSTELELRHFPRIFDVSLIPSEARNINGNKNEYQAMSDSMGDTKGKYFPGGNEMELNPRIELAGHLLIIWSMEYFELVMWKEICLTEEEPETDLRLEEITKNASERKFN